MKIQKHPNLYSENLLLVVRLGKTNLETKILECALCNLASYYINKKGKKYILYVYL